MKKYIYFALLCLALMVGCNKNEAKDLSLIHI